MGYELLGSSGLRLQPGAGSDTVESEAQKLVKIATSKVSLLKGSPDTRVWPFDSLTVAEALGFGELATRRETDETETAECEKSGFESYS